MKRRVSPLLGALCLVIAVGGIAFVGFDFDPFDFFHFHSSEASGLPLNPTSSLQPAASTDKPQEHEGVEGIPSHLIRRRTEMIQDLDQNAAREALKCLVTELQGLEGAGLELVCDFLRNGQDAEVTANERESERPWSGDAISAPTLRTALIAALHDWPGRGADAVSLEVLQTTRQLLEAVLAARNLESRQPNLYTQVVMEAIESIAQDTTIKKETRGGWERGSLLMEALAYFGRAELLQSAENAVIDDPLYSGAYAAAIRSLPSDTAREATLRLIRHFQATTIQDTDLRNYQEHFRVPEAFLYADYTNEEIRAAVIEMMRARPSLLRWSSYRYWKSLILLQGDFAGRMFDGVLLHRTPAPWEQLAAAQRTQSDARLTFLNELAQSCEQPEWPDPAEWRKVIEEGRDRLLKLRRRM